MAKMIQEELLNEQIAALSPAKRALLELKLRRKTHKSADRASIPRRSQHSPTPLSFAQQRLWFLNQLEPDSPAYNMAVVRRLTGELDVAALEWAFGEIVRRHESLRTRFESVGGVPQQVIDEPVEWRLKVLDLSAKEPEERLAEAQRLSSEEAQRPFALEREWGLRTQLLRLSESEHILLLTLHHIVSDGWSMGVLFSELQQLYTAHQRGESSPLPDLPLQYADFAAWQREWLSGAELDRQLTYWQAQLAGAAPVELPHDRPRPSAPSYRGEKQSLRLSVELSEQLQAVARGQGVTLFMLLMAAFQVLLSRYSGQTDISVGTPIANRNQAQLEELIGVFVNTLVLRTDLSGDPSFVELLRRVREAALAGYAHQDLPFEKLVDELHPERTLSRNPLFDVIFAMQNAPRNEMELNGLSWKPWGEGSKRTRVDLEVHVSEAASELVCTFVYATDLFETATIRRLMGHYEQLLTAVSANFNVRLSELSLLTSAERSQLLAWNETSAPYPQQRIQELFETQAKQRGAAIAVRCGTEELSFAALNERANRLAHYLRKIGIGPEVLVGICMERSPLMVIGVLGVLKAGGAYVPLDPAYPADRLQFMLEDAAAPVLLTVSDMRDRFLDKLPSGTQLVCLDSMWKQIAQESPENPPSDVAGDNLSYVIFTSGSTGKPKGVCVSHAALSNLVSWHISTFKVSSSDRATLLSGVGFDASVWELWPYLCCGASLDLPPENVRLSPEQLRDWLTQRQITISFVPTPVAEPMLNLQWHRNTKLRTLLTGGDRLHAWPSASLPFEVVNNYGPTENAVVSTSGLVAPDAGGTVTAPSLGRPISNVRVYILDVHGEPVPVGVPGELYVGGVGMARAYLNRADLTAERFIPDPFADSGGRIYRTGDLARYLADGSIEYLGRTDHQLKLRGFRIELGEIESALDAHPAVKQAVVLAREDTDSSKRLVAYIVPEVNGALTIDGLRTALQKSLPGYMIPSAFVVLDQLPLTESGKVDRLQLPAPDNGRPELSETFVAPRTPLEQDVARIWEQVLKFKGVGVYDNFFTLGGHSLLAPQVISRVNESLQVKMSLRTLFEYPTIADFAHSIEQATASGESFDWPTVMKIQPLGTRRPIFFVAAPDINALGYLALADHLGDDQPLYGLQSQKYLQTKTDEHGRPLLEFSQAVVEELASEYVRAMREVQPHGPYLLGGMCRGAHIAFEMAALLKAQGEPVSLLAILDTWVMENTYSYLFYVDYYISRTRWFLDLTARDKLHFVKDKISRSLDNIAVRLRLREAYRATLPPVTAVYWPDSSFVPRTFDGRITVFRVSDQPATRIRSHALGWESRSTGGVDVEIVPGRHGTLLRPPHVEVLASRLNEILAETEARLSQNQPV